LVATLALTLVMINVVLNVLGDLQRALVQQTHDRPAHRRLQPAPS
jgi:hypothetical protein